MSPIEKRLRASVKMGAYDGDANERSVCGSQMLEAATKIEQLQREHWEWSEEQSRKVKVLEAKAEQLERERDELRSELIRLGGRHENVE